MPRVRRSTLRLLVLAAAAAASWFVFVSWADRVAPVRAVPAGVAGAALVRDLDGLVGRVEGTRFAAAFAAGELARWLEGTETVRGIEQLRLQARGATGIPLERRHWLDVVGREALLAWSPEGVAGGWVLATRLSTRAWVAARVLLLLDRVRILPLGLIRERGPLGELLAVPAADQGHEYHAFLVGRLLVVGSDRELVRGAARCVREDAPALAQDESWRRARGGLPGGAALLWSRSADAVAPWLPGAGAATGAVAASLVADGDRLEVHLLAAGEPAPAAGGVPPPGMGLLARDPLLFLASRDLPPPALADLLAERSRRVAAREGIHALPLPEPAAGYLLVVSGTAVGGALPRPEGALAFTLPDERAARETIDRLFPASARTAAVAGTTARATRESVPLSGELAIWGAALARRVVLATSTEEIAALAAAEAAPAPADLPRPGWDVEAVSALSGTKALPLLRPWRPFLAGWLAARYRGLPNLAGDLELLGALRSALLLTGHGDAGRRGLLVLRLGDLPPPPAAAPAR